eukprot:5898235-Amphidinium_carterae.3
MLDSLADDLVLQNAADLVEVPSDTEDDHEKEVDDDMWDELDHVAEIRNKRVVRIAVRNAG